MIEPYRVGVWTERMQFTICEADEISFLWGLFWLLRCFLYSDEGELSSFGFGLKFGAPKACLVIPFVPVEEEITLQDCLNRGGVLIMKTI